MRTIKVKVPAGHPVGRAWVVPVLVDWPELRLTDDQILANVLAVMDGERPPYPEPFIHVEIEVEVPDVPA